MKNKTPLILGGAFAVLLLVYFVTTYNPPEKTKGATALFPGEKPVIDKLVMVSQNRGQTVIEKQNGVWSITSSFKFNAAQETVEQTVTTLLDVMNDGVITNRVDAQNEYEVSDSTAFFMTVYSGEKVVLDAVIGKHSTDLTHTYARLKGSNDICIWRGPLLSVFNRDVNEWRDKTVYAFSPDDVLDITAVQGRTTRNLACVDTLWTYKENGAVKPVDQNKVKAVVNLIANMSCDAFADDEDIPRAGTKDPDVTVSFKVRNGDVHTYSVWIPGEKDAGRYLVRKKDGDALYRFYQYRGELLFLDYEKLKP